MIRSIFILALVSTLAVGCSRPAPQQAAGAGTDASAPPTASRDAAQPEAQSAPAATPAAAAGQAARPANAEAPSPAASATPTPAPAPAPAPAPPPEPPAPKFREVTIPTGTSLSVTLATPLASDTSKPEEPVKGALANPIVISGATVVPKGADLSGSVIEANGSKRVKGKASIVFQFDHLMVRGENHRIATSRVKQEAAANTKQDAKKGALGGGVGAVVGGIAGGGKGAAIGAVAGSAGTVLATKGNEVELEAGTVVSTTLQGPLKVLVPVD
jgi:hypothetical protein